MHKRRAIRTGLGALCLAVGVASPAGATVITNQTTGTTLFNADYESGLRTTAGAITAGPDVTTTTSTVPPDPGPFQGSQYLRLFRDSDTTNQGNLFAAVDRQSTDGDVVRLRSMDFLPDDHDHQRAHERQT